MNKSRILLTILAGLMGSNRLFADFESVAKIDDKKVELYKSQFIEDEESKVRARVLVAGAVAAGMGLSIWYTHFRVDHDEVTRRANMNTITDLLAKGDNFTRFRNFLEGKPLVAEEKKNEPAPGYLKRFGSWIKKSAVDFKNSLPGFFYWVGQSWAYTAIMPYIFGSLPKPTKFLDFLFEARTINWCINKKTQLESVSLSIVQWFEEREKKEATDKNFEELNNLMNHFVEQNEKILGFMTYTKERLNATKDGYMRTRSGHIQDKFKDASDYISQVAQLVINKSIDMSEATANIKMGLLELVQTCEDFKDIQKYQGVEDVVEQRILKSLQKRCLPKEIKNNKNVVSDEEMELVEFARKQREALESGEEPGFMDFGLGSPEVDSPQGDAQIN